MSASPSGPSNSGTPTANGGPPRYIRKPKPADPLRKNQGRPQRAPPLPKSATTRPNGLKPNVKPGQAPLGSAPSRASGPGSSASNGASLAIAPTTFTSKPEGPYTDYPLFTTKRALRDGLRYHVARFTGRKIIDPSDQNQFTRPVTLQRRNAQEKPPGKDVKDEDPANALQLDDKEQEKLEIARLEKEAQRAADLAQIAPTGNNPSALAAKKNASFKNEKTTQVYRIAENEEQQREFDLRYMEALPWHLEDAENKHTWVGAYEAALSDTNVILFIDGATFKMVPIDKWYRFTPKNQFKTLTSEEAEAQMNKKSKLGRWAMHTELQKQQDEERAETRRFFGATVKVKGESQTFKRAAKSEVQDADDIDVDDDNLFQDDDEQPSFEPDQDEDTKYASEKIRREQLRANNFGERDQNEVEKEEEEEVREEEAKKKLGKKMKKRLKKREKNLIYESDSSHPYSTSSDDDTSDEEKKKEEERKKEEEAKLKAKSATKIPSGSSSKGTNTPLGRPKQGDQKKTNNLKRPGSPNLSASETSGNESSRKKHKKKHIASSSQPTGTTTPAPSRPMSPAPSTTQSTPARKSSIIKLNLNPSKLSEIQSAPPNPSAVMSDGEGTAGEMSDNAGDYKRKGIKLRMGSGPSHSPSASRAGSPSYGSRAGSPAAPAGSQSQGQQQNSVASPPASGSASKPAANPKPVTAEEIIAALPPAGISIGDILKVFTGRISDKKDRERFIRMVKENSSYSPEDKLLRPKS